jgi:anti-sigma B factor antagonist
MTDGHRLHESHIEGRGVDPAGAFRVERTSPRDGVELIVLAGELDMAAAPEVRAHIDAASGIRGVVLDLGEVTFVDSSMLKELLRAAGELDRYETRLVLAAVPGAVRRLLDLTRTTGMFTIAGDREAALRIAAGG